MTTSRTFTRLVAEAVAYEVITVRQARAALDRHQRTGETVILTATTRFTVTPETLNCDCGKGLHCPYTIQKRRRRPEPDWTVGDLCLCPPLASWRSEAQRNGRCEVCHRPTNPTQPNPRSNP